MRIIPTHEALITPQNLGSFGTINRKAGDHASMR
jgi:hypothetical protein